MEITIKIIIPNKIVANKYLRVEKIINLILLFLFLFCIIFLLMFFIVHNKVIEKARIVPKQFIIK